MARQKNIHPHLLEGETIVWTGAPCEDKDYNKVDRILLPISLISLIVSALFAATVIFSIVRTGFVPSHIAALLLVLLLGGFSIYSYFFRFAVKRRAKADLVYGVTSLGRVLIREEGRRKMTEFGPDQLADASITEVDKHGVGTIYLTPKRFSNWLDNTGLDFLSMSKGRRQALFDVADCKKVLKLIRAKH